MWRAFTRLHRGQEGWTFLHLEGHAAEPVRGAGAAGSVSLGGPVEERGKSGPSKVAYVCVGGLSFPITGELGYDSNLKFEWKAGTGF